MGKKYLFLLNLPEQRDLAEKVTDKFMQKSFCVESEPVLIMIGDKNSVNENYFIWTRRKIYCYACYIQIACKNLYHYIPCNLYFYSSTNSKNIRNFLLKYLHVFFRHMICTLLVANSLQVALNQYHFYRA